MANNVRPEFAQEEILDLLVHSSVKPGEKKNINILAPELNKVCVVDFDATVHNNLENIRIKALGNIRFLGTLTNCSILVAGKADFESECINCEVHAKEDITLRIGRFSDIYTEGNATVGVESHNCIISAGEAINAENATIFGGKLSAFSGITVGRAFKPNDYVTLTLALQQKDLIFHKQTVLSKQIQFLEKTADELKLHIQNTVKRLLAEKKLSGVHPEIEELKRRRADIEKQIEDGKTHLRALQPPLNYDVNNRIVINDRLSQGAIIEIGNIRNVNPSTLEKVELYTDGKKIETKFL